MSIKSTLSLIAVTMLLTSCTEEIPFDLNEAGYDRVVVEGYITDQAKQHEIRLSKTTSYFNAEVPDAVSGAMVTISNGLNTWTLTEDPVGSGRYYTPADAAGTAGLDHQLTIEYDGETYVAIDHMYPVAVLDSLYVEFMEYENGPIDDEIGYWEIQIWTVETPDVENFYRWRTIINGVSDGDTTRYSSYANDIAFDGAVLEGMGIEGYGQESIMLGDTVTLEQHAISEEYYDMLEAVFQQTEIQGGLFDPPPANVPSNVSNGALGFFSASSVSELTVIVD